MSKPRKCANEACTCVNADGSKFCSRHCEGMAGKTELVCQCNCPGCGATTARVYFAAFAVSPLSPPPREASLKLCPGFPRFFLR